MVRKAPFILCCLLCLALLPGSALAGEPRFTPGAAGVGDPYYPLDGNGGYDVQHYLLDLSYDPATDNLAGSATIDAKATQNLSRFNLDFDGLTVRSIKVDGRPADWNRDNGELIVQPARGLRDGAAFNVVVRYDGVPQTLDEFGLSGFIHTDDGAIVAGQPHGAATWFPVNDHPSDKAAYTIKLTVPRGLQAISNGVLEDRHTNGDWTTWTWEAKEPMASYLVTAAIGKYNVSRYRADGIRYWDALDTQLFDPVATPHSGTQLALSQIGNLSYKRLAHTISVPAGGAQLSFWVTRDTEPNWDFLFVEAHTVGQDDWTTLPDANGHTSQDTGRSCPYWLSLHPFLTHYQTDNGDGTCAPSGTSGAWWAVSGKSDGYEQWSIDLSAWAGKDVEVSISYASDDTVQHNGVFVDDIVVSTGVGSTSFEDDGDALDGWVVLGAPEGSAANPNDWIVGTVADVPPPTGEIAQLSFAREPEIVGFLSGVFGPYPFSAAGGIVDGVEGLGFALETQTRPIYSRDFFTDQLSGDSVLVHELAHQWTGDSLALAKWRHIWLNEGFATYAEWLWSEREGLGSAQDIFDFYYAAIPADDPFWSVKIGDPGPDLLFDIAVYYRGAMTLHELRLAVGDEVFFRILREWAQSRAGGNVTTAQFIRLAERISGQDLDQLFDTWLFSTEKPVLSAAEQARVASAAATRLNIPAFAQNQLKNRVHKTTRR
jgi:hypothetical protein